MRRERRFNLGKKSTKRCKKAFRKNGFRVVPIGQEKWFPKGIHKDLRYVYDNKVVDFLRYFPDLFVYKKGKTYVLIQVKATSPNYQDGENFSIETKSLENDKRLSKAGIKTFIVFENKPYKFYGDWAESIPTYSKVSYEKSKNFIGSGTPTTLVKKKDIPELDFKKIIKREKGNFGKKARNWMRWLKR